LSQKEGGGGQKKERQLPNWCGKRRAQAGPWLWVQLGLMSREGKIEILSGNAKTKQGLRGEGKNRLNHHRKEMPKENKISEGTRSFYSRREMKNNPNRAQHTEGKNKRNSEAPQSKLGHKKTKPGSGRGSICQSPLR